MKPTLLILAAGMASRYGSMKQTEGFGPSGETIMDYSIYDAIHAGFGKVVFIIRKDFADNFKAVIEPKLKGRIVVDYVYQERKSYVDSAFLPSERTKPWGTGHAMLCAKEVVKEPFAVINADDFYGSDAFIKAANFLMNACTQNENAIVGYKLAKTLSDFGTVSRGVCEINEQGNLKSITERTKIYLEDSHIVYEENDQKNILSNDTNVSMNFWCFHPSIFNLADLMFKDFPKNNFDNIKSEFFITTIADHFVNVFKGNVKMLSTSAQWFGVTYKEDAPTVKNKLHQLIDERAYPSTLWK